jgi:hypothetical protein
LTVRVIQRIGDDPRLAGQRITVHAQNGVVTLSGTVSSLFARVTAADLVRGTPGVNDISNRLALARAADVTAMMERPDPFDEMIAWWDGAGSSAARRPLGFRPQVSAAAAVAAALTWLPLLRYGAVAVFIALPCTLFAVILRRRLRIR